MKNEPEMDEINEWLKCKISELNKHINENTWNKSTINDRNFLCKIESKLKNFGGGEAGTGYTLLSNVLDDDLKCCGNCKCYNVIRDYGSFCIQDTKNGLSEVPVEHTAICDDWMYEDYIKNRRRR